MISTHLFGRRQPARHRAALAALTAAAAIAAAAPSAAHAGTYSSYACDVPGINLPAPTKGAWTNYDNSGHIQHWDSCATQSGRGGASAFQINYPYGVLAQNTGVGVELQIPASGPLSAISIDRVIDWTTTQLTPQGAGQAPAGSARRERGTTADSLRPTPRAIASVCTAPTWAAATAIARSRRRSCASGV
jgi:hypothetical protein